VADATFPLTPVRRTTIGTVAIAPAVVDELGAAKPMLPLVVGGGGVVPLTLKPTARRAPVPAALKALMYSEKKPGELNVNVAVFVVDPFVHE
jgi:hypothetical protein